LASHIELGIAIYVLPAEPANRASINFAAHQPQDPISLAASSVQTEPTKGFARVTSVSDSSSGLLPHCLQIGMLKYDLLPGDSQSRNHLFGNC
jgi:hypothetical protein